MIGFFGKKKEPKNTTTDRLTGLKNRDYFHQNFGELGVFKEDQYLTMVVFDVDHFKAANEIIDGDRALKDIVRFCQEEIQDRGLLMRWGGDEFLAILEYTPEETLKRFKEFIHKVEEHTAVTVSAGIVEIRHADTIKTNYYRAVQKCYLVKEMGGNGVKL